MLEIIFGKYLIKTLFYSEPSAVVNLSAVNIIENVIGLRLSWEPPTTAPTCVDHYAIDVDGSVYNPLANESSLTIPNLKSCTYYLIKIAPIDFKGKQADTVSMQSEPTKEKGKLMIY